MSLPDLEKKADLLYSRALRKSKADHRDMIQCITCPTTLHWKEMECSHFKPRKYKTLRYLDINTQCQCPACNRLHNDNTEPYMNWILLNLPAGTLTLLNKKMNDNIYSLDYIILLDETIKQSKLIPK